MTVGHAWERVMGMSVLAASLFVMVTFNRYASQPATIADVIRVSAALPSSYEKNLPMVLPMAELYHLDYLAETTICLLYSTARTQPVTSLRTLDGMVAALVIWLLYRVGSMCADKLTAVAACLMLALLPPQSWHMDSMRILAVLLHFGSFLYAIRKDNATRWAVFLAFTLLLFSTGVYAESLLLLGWFVTLGVVWIVWRVCARRLRRHGDTDDTFRSANTSHHSHNTSLWRQIQRDSGLLRFVALLIIVTLISFLLVFVTGVFFSQFTLSLQVMLGMIGVSIVLSALSACIMLVIPSFVREREIIIDLMFMGDLFRLFSKPDMVFRPIRLASAYRMLAAYALASCIFLPALFAIRNSLGPSPDHGTHALLGRMAREGSAWEWAMLAAPLLFVLTKLLGYSIRMSSRSQFIGSCALFVPSCLYIVLPQYSVFSVPFCLLCMAGLLVAACRLVLDSVTRRFVLATMDRPTHDS